MENIKFIIEKSSRIGKLIDNLYEKMPEIESSRGKLVTESYKATAVDIEKDFSLTVQKENELISLSSGEISIKL